MDKRTVGTWSVVAVLMAILAAAVVFAYEGALMFFSSRAGYDNPPQIETQHPDDQPRRST